jgi:hypothetical protein
MKNNNLSHILHRCQKSGESKPSLSPIFQASIFPVLVMILRQLFWRDGDEFGKTERVFFSRTGSYTITSFRFHKYVIFWEIQVSELTPIFSSSTHLSWQTVQNFQGFVSIFGQVVDFDLLSLGESIFYKFCNLNVLRSRLVWI